VTLLAGLSPTSRRRIHNRLYMRRMRGVALLDPARLKYGPRPQSERNEQVQAPVRGHRR
jgi:hypothetical protein